MKKLIIIVLLLVGLAGADYMNFAGGRGFWTFKYSADIGNSFWTWITWDTGEQRSPEELWKSLATIRKNRPGAKIYNYHSACTTRPLVDELKDLRVAVQAKLLSDDLPESWILPDLYTAKDPNRFYLDMRKKPVRSAVIEHTIAGALKFQFDGVGIDNGYWKQQAPTLTGISKEEWHEAMLLFYAEMTVACKLNNLDVMFNVATWPEEIPEALRFMTTIGANFMTEMAAHPNTLAVEERLSAEILAYKEAVEAGTTICLFSRHAKDETLLLLLINKIALNNVGPRGIFVSSARRGHDNMWYNNGE